MVPKKIIISNSQAIPYYTGDFQKNVKRFRPDCLTFFKKRIEYHLFVTGRFRHPLSSAYRRHCTVIYLKSHNPFLSPLVMEYVATTTTVCESAVEQRLLSAIAESIGEERFEFWFGKESALLRNGECIKIKVRNQFIIDGIKRNIFDDIKKSCLSLLGFVPNIDFIVNTNTDVKTIPDCGVPAHQPRVPATKIDASPMNQLATVFSDDGGVIRVEHPKPTASRKSPLRPSGTRQFSSLKSFVEGISNRDACQIAKLVVQLPGQVNPIYLYGPTSVGKSHLLGGIWSEFRRQAERKSPYFLTAEQFISSYLGSIQPGSSRGSVQSFRNNFKNISVLLIDDIQLFAGKNATQAELLNTIDTLKSQGVQMVFSGDRPLKELTKLRSDLLSRLESGVICEIKQPERELSYQIFRNMVEHRQLPIGDDVCLFVASRLGTHANLLLGALNRLHTVYWETKEPVTLALAEQKLDDYIRNSKRPVRLEDINKAVCETFGLSDGALHSKSRSQCIVAPRMLAMWLARKYTRSALTEIGKFFGNRTHSTVLTAQKKVDQWVDANHPIHTDSFETPISEAIQKIERILQGGL